MTKFIVIGGQKNSGKNTVANYIEKILETHGHTTLLIAVAKPVKDICQIAFNIDPSLLNGTNEDKNKLTDVMWDNLPISIRMKYSNDSIPGFGTHLPVPRKGFMTVREVLQIIGTDIFREMFGKDIWAKKPFIDPVFDYWDFVCITDCRFPEEIKQARLHNSLCLYIDRAREEIDTHESETTIVKHKDFFDYIIDNNGTHEQLKDKINDILKKEGLI